MILWDIWFKAVEFTKYNAHIEEWFGGDDENQINKNEENNKEEIKDIDKNDDSSLLDM